MVDELNSTWHEQNAEFCVGYCLSHVADMASSRPPRRPCSVLCCFELGSGLVNTRENECTGGTFARGRAIDLKDAE